MSSVSLSSILYVTEAAKSADYAVKAGLAAIRLHDSTHKVVVLVSTKRVVECLPDRPTKNEDQLFPVLLSLNRHLIKSCMVGYVTAWKNEGNSWTVNTAAGVNKFGPLAYELLLNETAPEHLRCDDSITSDAWHVWRKMHERPDVEHIWAPRPLDRLSDILVGCNDSQATKAARIVDEVVDWLGYPEEPPTEAQFYSALEELGHSSIPQSCWCPMYAYRLLSAPPTVKVLFDNGDRLTNMIMNKLGVSANRVRTILLMAAADFFNRRYHSK